MVESRLLQAGDEARLEAFLSTRAEESLLMLSNLKRAGLEAGCAPYQGRYAAMISDGRVTAAAAHYWNGNLIVQAPEALDELLEAVLADMRQPIRGVLGPADQVARVRQALDLEDAPTLVAEDEDLMAVALDALVLPDALAAGRVRPRRSRRSELELLANWRADYEVASLGFPETPELRRGARKRVERYHREGSYWVLERGGQLVAACSFIGAYDGLVQVGGVWTPPGQRGRGYARAVVAGNPARTIKQIDDLEYDHRPAYPD